MQTKIRAEQTNTDSATQTLTNKTLTSPVINTGISGTAIDTTTTLGTSDTKVPSQKAVKTYVDTAPSSWTYVSVSRSGTPQSISSSTSTTTVVFNSEQTDLLGEFNNSTGIFTASVAGYYCYDAQISWSPGFSGATRIRALCAGRQQKYLYYGSVSGYTPCCISGSTYLTVGQTIYIDVRQESGTTQNVYHDGGLTNLNIVRVR